MRHFIPNWWTRYRQCRYARERENALQLLGVRETDLRIISDMKTGQIRLIRSAGYSPHNLGLEIAESTYTGLQILGGTNLLVEYGPRKLLKRARDILNTKALSPIEFKCVLATLAAYYLALKETPDSKSQIIQSKRPYRPIRQRAKRR